MAAEDVAAQLELEYCPPLDAALLQAILLDFDLNDQDSLGNARDILESLRASAVVEADTAFDATGTSHISINSLSAEGYSDTADTDLTSLSNGVSRLNAEDDKPDANVAELDSLDQETKAVLLQELFPDVTQYTITHTLRKCNNEWQRALDELLNIAFFSHEAGSDGEKVAHKGVDAFAADSTSKRGRRKKRHGAGSEQFLDNHRTHSESATPANKWQSASGDIDFIAKHANLSTLTVRTAYYDSGASTPKAIARLLDDLMQSTSKAGAINDTIKAHAVELGRDFPTIKPTYLTALIQLTHPSTASAHELAKALTTRYASKDSGPIIPKYAPINLSDDESVVQTVMANTTNVLDGTAASRLAASHHEARRQLSAQAQAAYKKSRSQRLMGGAAAYYSSVSREHAASASMFSSAAADSLVAAQSTSSQLDLHGVTVQDAVRIADHKTRAWWAGLGENKANGRIGAQARQVGYRIVVGLGRHSEGGKSKIGPAVYNALTSNGWKVDKGAGYLTVTGRVRT